MRAALRSRTVQSDSASNKSDTEKPIKKRKPNKKSKKASKKTDTSLQSQSTDTDIFTKSPEPAKPKTRNTVKSKRKSTIITEAALKENISPNIKETTVLENSPKPPRKIRKITRRNRRHTSEEFLEFENVVTSTAVKPKKTRFSNIRESSDEQGSPRLSRNFSSKTNGNFTQNFDITAIKNESKATRSKNRSSVISTSEITRNSHEYAQAFKNIVTSTTIKAKKPKQSNKSNASKEVIIDKNDSASSNILLESDIINISDSITTNTNKNNVTDVFNSTYTKVDYEYSKVLTTNNSGEWKVEDQKSIINISDEIKLFESNVNNEIFTSPVNTNNDTKKVFFPDESLSKSARKKWERFPRNSQGANSVLEQISSPQKKSLPNKSLNISKKMNKTANTTLQSAHKIKRTAMPNFALIHQKAYEKMESITEYSQRKKDRVNLLLSNKKVQLSDNKTIETGNKIKSVRELFSNEKPAEVAKIKFNRFGFKEKVPSTNTINKPPVKPLPSLKPSIYDRGDILAIANKKGQNTGKGRENKRDLLKGVRTNRRFELLMKMRNN